jgi:transglutaminase-like putative cysteine protease
MRPALMRPAIGYKGRAGIVALVLVVLVFSPPTAAIFGSYAPLARELLDFNPNTVNQRTFPLVAYYNLTRSVTMSAPGGAVTYSLTFARAGSLPGKQEVLAVQPSPAPTATSDKYYWNGTIASGSSVTVSIRYSLKMTTFVWTVAPSELGTRADVPPAYAKYLDEEWRIDPDSSAVQTLANQITAGKTNYMDQVDALYTWLLSNYQYAKDPDPYPRTPEATQAARGGDCDDFSVLFISMARYLGIPAWLELGLLFDEFRREWGAHGWATVYIPFKNGTGVEATIDVVNKLYLIRDPYHFSDWSADGDATRLQSYYQLVSYSPNNPFTVTESITNDSMVTQGAVNYFHG